MFQRSSPLRRPKGWCRQVALTVLLALQGAIAFSALLEPTEKGWLGAHAEAQGAVHQYQHDESTCAVCAVRSLHPSPAPGCAPIVCERQQSLATLETPAAAAVLVDPTTLPRAPPPLS